MLDPRGGGGTGAGLGLQGKAPEMLAFGELDHERLLLGHPTQLGAAPHRDQEEHLPKGDVHSRNKLGQRVELIPVPSTEAGINLDRDAQRPGLACRAKDDFEGARGTPKRVMGSRRRAVEAESDLVHARFF